MESTNLAFLCSRFGAIESIVDEQGEDLDDAIPRGCHICVFFDSTEAVDRVLKFKHEVVEVRGRGRRHREEEYFHSDRREDLYRHYSMAEAHKGVEDNIERNNLNKSNANNPASNHTREKKGEPYSLKKRQRSESRCSSPTHQHSHRRSQSRRSPPFTLSPAARRPRRLPSMQDGLVGESSSILNPPMRSEYWAAEFAELGRKNEIKKEEDRKEAWKVQSRLLALVNKSPTSPREEEVIILDAVEQPDAQRFREEAKKLDQLEHAKEKAEYAAILKSFNIVELPVSQPACIELSDSD